MNLELSTGCKLAWPLGHGHSDRYFNMNFSQETSAEDTAAPVDRRPSSPIPRGVLLLAFVAVGGLLTLVLQGFGVWGDSPRTEYILNDWLTVALQGVAVGVIAARALTVRRDRWI